MNFFQFLFHPFFHYTYFNVRIGGDGQKVNPVALIESLLHGGKWQNYRFFSISTDIYVGGFAGYAYYLKIDAIQLNIFAYRIFTLIEKCFVNALSDNTDFSFSFGINVVDKPAVTQFVVVYQVVIGINSLGIERTRFLAADYVFVLTSTSEKYRRDVLNFRDIIFHNRYICIFDIPAPPFFKSFVGF